MSNRFTEWLRALIADVEHVLSPSQIAKVKTRAASVHHFVFVAVDTSPDPAEIARIAPGLQAQLNEDLAKTWDGLGQDDAVDGSHIYQQGTNLVPAETVPIFFHKVAPADEQGALALHADDGGKPAIHCFDDLIAQAGVSLSSSISHELLELNADEDCTRIATLPDGRKMAVEIADQVEALTYTKNGVEVSDFATPSNFGIGGSSAPFDFLGKQTEIAQVLAGGYAQFLTDDGWQMITAREASAHDPNEQGGGHLWLRRELTRRGLSRAARRTR